MLLFAHDLRDALKDKLQSAKKILVMSAYVTTPAIKWLREVVPDGVEVKIVSRFNPNDLLSNSSDLNAIKIAQTFGWEFHIIPNLHAKICLIDTAYLFVGSANLTANGLMLYGAGNLEINNMLVPSARDINLIHKIAETSSMLTPDIVDQMEAYLSSVKKTENTPIIVWPQKLMPSTQGQLLVADLLWTIPEKLINATEVSPETLHDRHILFGDSARVPTFDMAKKAFECSKICAWLTSQLLTKDNSTLFFGELTERIHSSLVDEPAIYRKDVKLLVKNLYAAIKFYQVKSLKIIRPHYSEAIVFSK